MATNAKPRRVKPMPKASATAPTRQAARSATGRTKSAPKPPARVRKNMDMDPEKLRRVRALLGTTTDTETVDKALELILFRKRFERAMNKLADSGGIEDIWDRM